ATGVAVFLFPAISTPLMVALRSAMHFVFVLVLVWSALGAFIPDPTRIAFAAAMIITGLIALGLYLDIRDRSAMHFVFVLVLVWSALGAFIPDPTRIAFAAAMIITGLIALGLYLDS